MPDMPIQVEKIKEGTVIDHITAGKGMKVMEILGIGRDYPGKVALVMNVASKRIGKKDIVKVAGKFIDEKDANRIALISPKASLNIIKNGEVEEKKNVEMPDSIEGIAKCPNPKCITNLGEVETRFEVEKGGVRCDYCERRFEPEEIS